MISFGIFKHFVYHYFLIVLVNGSNNHSRPFEKVDFDICPFTNFCHQNATAALNMKGKVPCCTPCSCSDNCWGLGNCCPDKELIGHSVPELKCALAMVKEPGIKAYNGYNYKIPRYRIVTNCPNEENNITLVDKCTSENKTSILDYTWVTDESTGRIFQNEYCARCHGVDRYFKWQIRTTYRSVLSANFSSLPNSIHSPYCELMVEQPDDRMHLADNYRCYRANRAKCNITGRWQDYDSDVELACRTYVSPIIYYSPFSMVYKNIYCYYCNGFKAQQFTHSCPDLYKGQRGDLRTSFSALIDFTERQANGISPVCDQHEIFDKFTHGCHTLLCPFGSAAWYGTCVALAIETQGLTVTTSYMLELKWKDASASGQQVYLADDETLGELIQDNFLKLFNVKLKQYRFCRLEVLVSERNKTQLPEVVILSITLFTNSRCQLDSIFDKFTTIFGKVIEVPVYKSVLVFGVILEKRRLSDVKGMKLAFRNKVCPQMYILDKEKVCPEVEVSSSFLKSKIKDTRVLSGIMCLSNNQTDLRDNTTIKLCWDDYVSMMTESYAGAATVSHRYLVPAMHVSQIMFILIFRQILF